MTRFAVALAATLALAGTATAGINIPGDGSDGGLYVASNTVIDLSLAVTGNWDDDNSANAGVGIYDSNKWAVVFKYTNVTVNAGRTVTFNNHPSRAPVVWLVAGNATISGAVALDGQNHVGAPALSEPGPGGFRGGMGRRGNISSGSGFGPGGDDRADGGTYSYGNASLVPLVGGSGGGGGYNRGGGGGGGAILIACREDLSISGSVRAKGGTGHDQGGGSGGGSGGGIRLVAETFSGSGTIAVNGGTGGSSGSQSGGKGRIRTECVSSSGNHTFDGNTTHVALDPGATPQIWLPTNGPSVKLVSVAGEVVPQDPRAGFGIGTVDVLIPQTNSAPVIVETVNVSTSSVVNVRITPRAGTEFSTANAAVHETVSENPETYRWLANVPVSSGYAVVQVRVIRR